MKLASYLDINGITDAGFAQQIGVTRQTVSRYRAAERRPTEAIVLRIYIATNGQVAPNDFVDKLPKLRIVSSHA